MSLEDIWQWIEQKLKEARKQAIEECIKITEEQTESEYLAQNKWAQIALDDLSEKLKEIRDEQRRNIKSL